MCGDLVSMRPSGDIDGCQETIDLLPDMRRILLSPRTTHRSRKLRWFPRQRHWGHGQSRQEQGWHAGGHPWNDPRCCFNEETVAGDAVQMTPALEASPVDLEMSSQDGGDAPSVTVFRRAARAFSPGICLILRVEMY